MLAVCVNAAVIGRYVVPPKTAYAPETENGPMYFDYNANNQQAYDAKDKPEYSDGNGYAKGSNRLVEPDRSTRGVEYTGDEHDGFRAETNQVRRDYEEETPANKPAHPASVYRLAY